MKMPCSSRFSFVSGASIAWDTISTASRLPKSSRLETLKVGWVITLVLAGVESGIIPGEFMVSMKNSAVFATVRLIKTISRMLVAVAIFLL